MQVTFPVCQVIGVDRFESKKGTQCGSLSWFDMTEGKVYRVMCFGEDVQKIASLYNGVQCSVTLELAPSRRDFSVEVRLVGIDAPVS